MKSQARSLSHPLTKNGRRLDDVLVMVLFVLLGTVGLAEWQATLSMLYHLKVPDKGLALAIDVDVLNAVYTTFVLLLSTAGAVFNAARDWVLISAIISTGILCSALGFICTFATVSLTVGAVVVVCPGFFLQETDTLITECSFVSLSQAWQAAWLFHVYAVCVGCSVGIGISSAVGIAASTPRLYVGFVGAGLALGGLPPWLVWLVAKYGVFSAYSRDGVIKPMWLMLSLSISVCAFTLALYLFLTRSIRFSSYFEKMEPPSVKETPESVELAEAATNRESEASAANNLKTYERLGFWGVMWETKCQHLWRFIIFYQTMMVFPSIGPLSWKLPPSIKPLINDICIVGVTMISRHIYTI